MHWSSVRKIVEFVKVGIYHGRWSVVRKMWREFGCFVLTSVDQSVVCVWSIGLVDNEVLEYMLRCRERGLPMPRPRHRRPWHARTHAASNSSAIHGEWFSIQSAHVDIVVVRSWIIEKKLQFITLLTAICIVSHIENSKNDKGYIT